MWTRQELIVLGIGLALILAILIAIVLYSPPWEAHVPHKPQF